MNVLYEKSFLKDLRKLKNVRLKKRVNSIIDEVKKAENEEVIFSRFLHRKDIYRKFP